MAESTNGGTKPNQPKTELSMEKRLLIAFILMGAVLFLTPYFYKSAAPLPPQKKAAAVPPPAPAKPESTTTAPEEPGTRARPAPASKSIVAADKEETYVIDTDLYRIVFGNRGAVVRSWMLKKYRAHSGQPLELVNTAAKADPPFTLYFRDAKPSADPTQALFAATQSPGVPEITFQYTSGSTTARKTFRFHKTSYLAQITTQVTENGKDVPHYITWRGGFGDLGVVNPAGNQTTLHFDGPANKLVKQTAKDAKNGPVNAAGNFLFAGIEDTYFTAAFLPEATSSVETITFKDSVATPVDQNAIDYPGVGISDGGTNRFSLFIGPKDLDILRSVNPRLEQLVDFGWFAFLAKPLFLMVNWFNDSFVHNYGWSIVLVTILLNCMLFPLKISSMKSMKKMQALQPQIAGIQEKYKGISMTDPRRAQRDQETMELYKKHGVNPMGGCMPMVLQIPFFIAFYKVFSVSVEMRGANWLWVSDLSQPEHWFNIGGTDIRILPVAMIASQFYMQRMTPSTSADPSQRRMMLLMPLVFGFMFYGFSSGLVLYYLTSNLVGIAQQVFFNKTGTTTDLAPPAPAGKGKSGRK